MIYVLYGQPGAGKTCLGERLANYLSTPFMIDGDEFREMFQNSNYGREGREENINNANAVATYLNNKGRTDHWSAVYYRDGLASLQGRPVTSTTPVVMCLVNPYEHLRNELKEQNENHVKEILLETSRDLRGEHHVEDFERGNPDHTINTDQSELNGWNELLEIVGEKETRRLNLDHKSILVKENDE